MNADNKMEKKNSGGLKRAFIAKTIVPILIIGIIIIVAGDMMLTRGMHREVENGLKTTALSVLAYYDEKYPGDYNLLVNEAANERILRKGEAVISEDTYFIDKLKEQSDIEISLFFYDTRFLTTIKNAAGERIAETVVHKTVANAVLNDEAREGLFYKNVIIEDESYFAEYIPLFSESGVCLGMIGVAKTSKQVGLFVDKTVNVNIMLAAAAVVLFIIASSYFTADVVSAVAKIERFLNDMAAGKLDTMLDETIVKRSDEIGEMGRLTGKVQGALRKQIERDALTGLHNRRSALNKAAKIFDKNEPFAVAMGDIDFFKKVNDTYGHDAGDEVLKTVARILNDNMMGKGFVARWGGEEFLFFFERMTGKEAVPVLEDVLDEIRGVVIECGDYNINVTMSFGVVTGNAQDSIDSQIKLADNGLYYAKNNGRNRVVLGDDLQSQ